MTVELGPASALQADLANRVSALTKRLEALSANDGAVVKFLDWYYESKAEMEEKKDVSRDVKLIALWEAYKADPAKAVSG